MANFIQYISQSFGDLSRRIKGEPKLWHTKFGDIQLASAADRKQAQRIITQIQRTTEALTKSDIQKWRRAHQAAISVEKPDRRMLYEIYRDASLDGHLSGCVEQRHGMVLSRSFNIENAQGEPQPELKHYFEQPWFDHLCRLILDAEQWGHSLIELGNIITDGDGCPCYEDVRLVDRMYVIPEHHRVITDLGQDWTTGIDYHLPEWTPNLIEAGQPDSLGLLLKAAQYTIPKKNVLAAWDVFSEIFGIPMRIATTAARDKASQDDIARMLEGMATAPWGLFPEGTSLQIIEPTKGDAYNVFNQRIARSNSEISKLIIGQTMTIEDGSSLSQSQTHLKVLENLTDADAKKLAYVINNQLLPRMVRHGFPLQGMRFQWDDTIDYTPEQQLAYEQMIADRYEVDPQYFADKYNMPVGDRLQQPSLLSEETREKSEETREKSEESNSGNSAVSSELDGPRFARFFD